GQLPAVPVPRVKGIGLCSATRNNSRVPPEAHCWNSVDVKETWPWSTLKVTFPATNPWQLPDSSTAAKAESARTRWADAKTTTERRNLKTCIFNTRLHVWERQANRTKTRQKTQGNKHAYRRQASRPRRFCCNSARWDLKLRV